MTKGILIVLTLLATAAAGLIYLQNQELSYELELIQQSLKEQNDSLKIFKFREQFMTEKVQQLSTKLNEYQKVNLSNDSLYFLYKKPANHQDSLEVEAVSHTAQDSSSLRDNFIGLKQYIQNQNVEINNFNQSTHSQKTIEATEQTPNPTLSNRTNEPKLLNIRALNLSLPSKLETKNIETTKVVVATLKNLHYLFSLDNDTMTTELNQLGYTNTENTTYFMNKNISYCCFSIEKSAHKVSIFNSSNIDDLLKELQAQQIPQLHKKGRKVYRYIWNSNVYELQYQSNYANQVKVSLALLYPNKTR